MTPADWTGVIIKIAPKADVRFVESFARAAPAQFPQWGLTTATGVAGLLGHAAHETGGFRTFVENMNYSAARLRQVWPSRFPTAIVAQAYAGHPEKLANKVYANRMGNGPEDSGDGWRNRGGGLFQHTGKAEYDRVKRRTGHSQEEVRNPEIAGAMLAAALSYAVDRGMIPSLDGSNVPASTQLLNGGQTGVADRRILIGRAEAAMAGRSVPGARTTIERRDRAQAQAAGAVTTAGGAGAAGTVADGKVPQPAAAPSNAVFYGGLAVAAVLIGIAVWRFVASRREQSKLDQALRDRDRLLDQVDV